MPPSVPPLLSVTAAAALLSSALLALLLPLLGRWLPDQPNPRSAHRRVTPRGGGIVFALVGSGGALLLGSGMPSLCLPLALVGLADDRRSLAPALRLLAQLATALVLVWAGQPPTMALALLLATAAAALINLTNFMDGLDGLVAGCLVVLLATAAGSQPGLWPLVGALIGFLPWNWSPARLFMGDAGSTYLGAVFAGAVLQAPGWPAALALLLVATPLLADAGLCLLRRLLAGHRLWQAHRLHLYQRLQQAGWGHGRVAALYIGVTAALALADRLGGWPWLLPLAAGALLLGLVLERRVAVPFAATSTVGAPPQPPGWR
ncbi:glycosyltransferase family 4 protein [Cyanobium sp. NIES-981]|uniref:MraY family glycosyltransferase n=1 Tax=Cyanobium sp. NIES-981 TaxID=1851505 RepID=UPI0007DD00C7|nr:glycosyltransferase family 4 protein [Cyanobium sp. NIES-981]SBO44017.1 Undecaprenyl-phosphate alpha-N-acetylglucosaminyltransferase [Cyanobium sp. NIES-981]